MPVVSGSAPPRSGSARSRPRHVPPIGCQTSEFHGGPSGMPPPPSLPLIPYIFPNSVLSVRLSMLSIHYPYHQHTHLRLPSPFYKQTHHLGTELHLSSSRARNRHSARFSFFGAIPRFVVSPSSWPLLPRGSRRVSAFLSPSIHVFVSITTIQTHLSFTN